MALGLIFDLIFPSGYGSKHRSTNCADARHKANPAVAHGNQKSDLMLVFKIINGYICGGAWPLDHLLVFRGHSRKLKLLPFRVNARKNFFSVRVASFWNSLPEAAVNVTSISSFKLCLRVVSFLSENLHFFDCVLY